MNAYVINGYTIAAKNKNEAYYTFLEEENNLEYVFDNGLELNENEEDEFTITVRRLNRNEMNHKDIRCHDYNEDNCEICADSNDYVYYSIQELMDTKQERDFPCVIVKED